MPATVIMKLSYRSADVDDIEYVIAAEKLSFFFNTLMNNSIICGSDNAWVNENLIKDGTSIIDNDLVIIPSDPSDDNIAVTLLAKAQALTENAFAIYEIELESNGQSVHVQVDGPVEDIMPNMDEWVGPLQYKNYTKPWWARNDASTSDARPTEDSDLDTIFEEYDLSFIEESFRNFSEDDSEEAQDKILSKVIHKPSKFEVFKTDDKND